MLRRLRGAVLGLAVLGAPPAGAQTIDSLAILEQARALAHDSLLGRRTGTAGADRAARYLADRLLLLGLEPLHGASFLDSVPLLRVVLDPASYLLLRSGAGESRFQAGEDFVVTAGGHGSLKSFEGPIVYLPPDAGPAPPGLAGAVLLVSEPPSEAIADRYRAWIRAGVAGILLPVADAEGLAALRERAADRLIVAAPVDDPIWQPDLPIIHAGPALVRALIAGAPPPASPTEPLPLERTLEAVLRFRTEPVPAANVVGIVPGVDSALRDEIVLVTAHYDHLGVGPAVDGDSIYNGFSDNAAGVAMLLEMARILATAPPARSVVFLFTTGEEMGLLGSTAWAADPPIPLRRITAVLNLDAGAPPAPPVRWRVAGDTSAPAVRAAAAVVRRNGWSVDLTGANANSDHWPFMARGVPTVFLVPGREWQGLDAGQRDRLFAEWDRYHHPGDQWRPGYPLAGLTRYARLAIDIVRDLAN